MYASVAAAIAVGIAAGTWGARALQRSRPVATQMAAAPIVNAPVATSPVDAPAEPSAELIPSVELRPSIGAPVARVVANPPQIAAASQAVPDDRQPRDAAASTPRGTSGGASAAARAVPAPRPRTEPVPPAVAPMAAMNPAVTLPPPERRPWSETPAAAAQPAPRIPAAIARPEPEALPSVVARSEQSEIQRTLGQYRSAYQRLDAASGAKPYGHLSMCVHWRGHSTPSPARNWRSRPACSISRDQLRRLNAAEAQPTLQRSAAGDQRPNGVSGRSTCARWTRRGRSRARKRGSKPPRRT